MFAWPRKEMYGDVRWGRSSSWASCARAGAVWSVRWGLGRVRSLREPRVCVRAGATERSRSAGSERETHSARPAACIARSDGCGAGSAPRARASGCTMVRAEAIEARGPFVRFRGRLRNTELKELRFAARAYRHGDERNTARLLIAPGASIPDTRTDLRRAARTAVPIAQFGFRFAGHPISPEVLGTCQHHISRGLRCPRARRLRAEARRSQDVMGVGRRGIPQDRGCG